MSGTYLIAEYMAAVEKKTEEFFSPGTLSDKIMQAKKLSVMPGINLFITSLPWRIDCQPNKLITGFSETLRIAVQDIHAHLMLLTKVRLPSTPIFLEIDEAQLHALHKTKMMGAV